MLETQRLLLRPWRDSDREPFARMNADPRVMRYFPSTLSRAESDASVDRIRHHWNLCGFGLFAAELRSCAEFIGFIGIAHVPWEAHFTPAVEIGWRLDPAYWNHGLATEGARECLRYAFTDLAFDNLVSFTVSANAPSRRVMEKLGMTHHSADDFDNPRVPEGHPLRGHVLYRIRCTDFIATPAASSARPNW